MSSTDNHPQPELAQAMRLALSFREKARGSDDPRILRDAERLVQEVRDDCLYRLDAADRRLRRCGEARMRLSNRLTAGRVTPERANATNRAITAEIDALQESAHACRVLAAAQTASALGGFLDMPLDAYAGAMPAAARPPTRAETIVAVTLPFVAGVAVFCPWVRIAGAVYSLLTYGDLLVAVGVTSVPAPAARLLWMPYVLLPLLAIPFAGARSAPRMAWGQVVVGVLVLWLAFVPPAVAALLATTPAPESLLPGSPSVGALLYGAVGLAQVVLGGGRIRLKGTRGRVWLPAAVALAAALGLTAVSGIALLAVVEGRGKPVVSISSVDQKRGLVTVECRNAGRRPLALYLPWPRGAAQAPPDEELPAFGVLVQARERGRRDFRLVTESGPAWTQSAVEAPGVARVLLGPGASRRFVLDVRRLADGAIDASGLRLDFTDARGHVLHTYQVDFPERPAGEPTRAAAPSAPASSSSEPEPGIVPPAPTSAAVEGTSQPAAQTRPLSFTGRVGDRAVLSLHLDESQRPQRFLVGPGEEVIAGWVVVEIHRTPAEVVLRNRYTRERVTLGRAGSMLVPVEPQGS